MHTTFISQVFRGSKELSLEHAAALCDFFGFTEQESEFFVTLVEFSRATTPRLQKLIQNRIDQIRRRAKDLSERLPQDRRLTEVERATFYSNWYYSGIRLAASLPDGTSAEAIAAKLGLPRPLVVHVLAFLLENSLLCGNKDGFKLGPQRTHLESDSPFINGHHRNWRHMAMTRHDQIGSDELVFTAPLTIARKEINSVRGEIQKLIEQVSGVVATTTPDMLACLNIDWVIIA